ncbi:hypothetical protein P9A28_gp30 [Sphingomonas phage Eidolon]|uniref:Uncharacterized protein n=1 Tax=Sphingomonas phage Eidolon TaxID=2686311 RepID=A0A6M3T802_9CAUD|nr:hypothetical protein P9A28_gp30 [Sphingomonas phage Eidolon]QJD54416.1 hypothetical protein [Sphingomonas phage Eidolon]
MDRAGISVKALFAVVQNFFGRIMRVEPSEGLFMSTTTPSAPLLARTLDLVKNAPRGITYTMMAEAIGVSVAWVSRFAANNIADPGVNRVQALHDYLSNYKAG